MAYDIGINFRASSGYVSDGLNETYCIAGADAYPTTRGGVTFGNTGFSFTGQADRNSGNDRRLAGIGFTGSAGSDTFRIDLPASGAAVIHCAIGDASGGLTAGTLTFKDGSTTLGSASQVSTTAQHFTDAGGNDRTNATWPGNEVGLSVTFGGTVFNTVIDSNPSGSAFAGLAHLRVVSAGGGGGGVTVPVFVHHYRQQGVA